jgi:ribonuclease HI
VSLNCYTDASAEKVGDKFRASVACVIVVNGTKTILFAGGRPIGNFSSNLAEMIAICYALEEVSTICKALDLTPGELRVCSDNQSVVDLCSGFSETDSNKMLRLLGEVEKSESKFESVSYQWVRGHASNKYNELADHIAYTVLKG